MQVEIVNSHRKYAIDVEEVRRVVKRVFRHEQAKLKFISIVAVGHDLMRKLNRQFLHRDETTDVLAFPLGDESAVDGEVYINLDQAHRQARSYNVTPSNESTRLIIHGVLHLIGYRDTSDTERRRMKKREEALMQILGRGKVLRS